MKCIFNFDERVFLKQLNKKSKDEVISILKNIKSDDDIAKEFVDNLLVKIKNINEAELVY